MEPALRKDVVRSGNEVSVMAGSVNKVMLIGNLGKDPEVRRLNSGDPVVSLRIATSESWRDKTTGERKERTEWHDVVIFNENLGKVAVLCRGPATEPRMAGPAGQQTPLHRGRAAAIPRRADAA
jgi:hypothetical protein